MPVPLVALAAIGVSAAMSAWQIYQTNQSTKVNDKTLEYVNDFYSGAERENTQFWQDYIRRHHLEGRQVLYPYRTGFNYNRSPMLSSEAGLYSNSLARQGSYLNAAGRLTLNGLLAYSRPNGYGFRPMAPDVMYG